MSTHEQMIEIRHLFQELRQIYENGMRPAEQVILDDVDLRNYLKVSKRTTAYWREKAMITYSKLGGKIFYRLSDILKLIAEYEIPAVTKDLKISL